MLELVNLFSQKAAFIAEYVRKIEPEYRDIHIKPRIWTIKQHLAVLGFQTELAVEYADSLVKGKPDKTLFHNLDALSEKRATQYAKEKYDTLLKQYTLTLERLIVLMKEIMSSKVEFIEFVTEQLFIVSYHYGAIMEKRNILAGNEENLHIVLSQ